MMDGALHHALWDVVRLKADLQKPDAVKIGAVETPDAVKSDAAKTGLEDDPQNRGLSAQELSTRTAPRRSVLLARPSFAEAWARLATLSLRRIFCRWFFTV